MRDTNMRRSFLLCLPCLVVVLIAFVGPAAAQPKFAREVEQAIEKGVKYLWSVQGTENGQPVTDVKKKFTWQGYPDHEAGQKGGQTALVAYALLESGVSPQDPRMLQIFKYLGNLRTNKTYVVSLRANVWYVANQQTADKYKAPLKRDASLLARTVTGAYHYELPRPSVAFDNSNSQFGVLGMYAASRNDLEIKKAYWQAVARHWKKQQNADGGWGYYNGPPYVGTVLPNGQQVYYYGNQTQATMTVGGIATLFICVDHLSSSKKILHCEGGQLDPSIVRALTWINRNFAQTLQNPGPFAQDWYYYYLYGVERAALASGYKYFGQLDWYRHGTALLKNFQQPNGRWVEAGRQGIERQGATITNTAFALLFLIRGQQPVLYNKLEYDGDWNNRPRDMASAARFMGRQFEKSVNWQIIKIHKPVSEWRDAPILYIAGTKAPNFTPDQIRKLRTYVLQGGTILSVAECPQKSKPFQDGIRQVYKQMFPQYKLTACDAKHPIYQCDKDLKDGKPKFHIVSNGVRPLVIHTDEDLAYSWQARRQTRDKWAYDATVNLTLYIIGSVDSLYPRGVNVWPEGDMVSAASWPALAAATPLPPRHDAKAPVAVKLLAGQAQAGNPAGKADYVYMVIKDQIFVADSSQVGTTGKVGEQTITVPKPDAPGRVIVVDPQDGTRISIPESLLGSMIPTPDQKRRFRAERPKQAADEPDKADAGLAYESDEETAQAIHDAVARPGAVQVIRLKHNANPDPEPLAWQRFTNLMTERTDTTLDVHGPIEIKDLPTLAKRVNAKLAVMTGTEKLTLTAEQQKILKEFVAGGGTLLIDAAGGSTKFANSVAKGLLRNMYPDNPLRALASTAPLYSLEGFKIRKVKYRTRTKRRVPTTAPLLQAVLFDNRPGVIFSREDITAGLVGYSCYTVDGYAPDTLMRKEDRATAFEIMRNIVLFAGK